MTLTSLIISQHARPFQPLPMLFTPLLIFSSYLTLAGFKIDGAGMTAAWSGMYALLAARRRRPAASLRSRFFSVRGVVRGSAMALGAANAVAGLYVYATGDRKREEEERRELNR
ncbi:8e48aed0-eb55-456f-a8ec-0d05d7dba199 [Thermothielavioides terrestris]|uniref:8e48aed0-eb55-456f-a8ec-0d05d7dba199 n=1 Tax=Thermothielavioides terrestris TaxID=2587410 RepID=A0A3S4C3G1_9PEZI|nr:8e48aed0-eb55-456f-a8ec-0d05d7dba199 [Thermothielavioides terrestris]